MGILLPCAFAEGSRSIEGVGGGQLKLISLLGYQNHLTLINLATYLPITSNSKFTTVPIL
jgi:hypothetical protein